MTLLATALLLALCWSPAAAAAPGPVGPDIQVVSDDLAGCPAIVMSAGGDFEVVWSHYFTYSHPVPQGVFALHFDRQGRPTQAAPIKLDSPSSGAIFPESSFVNVVALPGSGYFVTWFERRNSLRNARAGMVGRFLGPTGRPRGPVLRLRPSASQPVALAVVNGNLLIAWIEEEEIEEPVHAQFFDLSGHPLGSVMLLIEGSPLGGLRSVALAPLADSFVAAWQRFGTDFSLEAQRFSFTGEPLGAPLLQARQSLGPFYSVPVASDGNDRFAIGWTARELHADPQTGQQAADDETRVRFFDAGGASSPEARPNVLFTGNQETTGLAMNRDGLTLATWQSDRNRLVSSFDVVGRFLAPDGRPASKAFPLPQEIRASDDLCASAATNGGDDWVVAWLVWNQAIPEKVILARRLTSAGIPRLDD